VRSGLDERLCPTGEMVGYRPKDAGLVESERRVKHKKGFS